MNDDLLKTIALNPALPDVKVLIKFICCKQISVITDLEKSHRIPSAF